MATQKKVVKKSQDMNLMYVIVAVIVIIVMAVVVTVMQQNEVQTTQSKATYSSGVSEGDDLYSLQKDLDVLGASTTNEDVVHITNLQ